MLTLSKSETVVVNMKTLRPNLGSVLVGRVEAASISVKAKILLMMRRNLIMIY